MNTRRVHVAAALLAVLPFSGCASMLESSNRYFFELNQDLDRSLVAPAVELYTAALPGFLRKGIGNFFANLNYLTTVTNDLLQGKWSQGGRDTGRLVVNTTVGIGGLLDPATPMGLEANHEDFGQTLGAWGVGDGPYLVLPLLGPTSLRDSTRIPYFFLVNPIAYINDPSIAVPMLVLWGIDVRANLDEAIEQVRLSAADPYVFTREAYLQHRRFLVNDGEVAEEEAVEEFEGLLEELQEGP